VLIALSLSALLLTVLFSFLTQSAKLDVQLEKIRFSTLERGYCQNRLQDIFVTATPGSFYTKQVQKESNPSLFITFDNGIDPDPLFSGLVRARIYIDSDNNFCLSLKPIDSDEESAWRKEILLSNIHNFEFRFLRATGAKNSKERVFPINASYCWATSWDKSRKDVPSLIRLSVQNETDQIQFAFILPSVDPFVTYTEKKSI
jgi:hypothetical protein